MCKPQPDAAIFRADLVHPSAFLAVGAIVRGNVYLGEESSVWFNCVVRGDTEAVRVGRRSNIQDLSVLHADPGFPCLVGDEVTVGHRAIVHGATIADRVMVGMGAIVLNGAQIAENVVVGAGAVVTEGSIIPSGVLALGVPAKVCRPLSGEEIERIRRTAAHYVGMAALYASIAQPRA